MTKEKYEKPKAKLVIFDLQEVYMLTLESKSLGEDFRFDEENEDENF